MRVYKTREFNKYAKKKKLSNDELCKAIRRFIRGLNQVNLDGQGGLMKIRVAREGSGASRGFRVILLRPEADVVICAHGYAKNEKEELTKADVDAHLDLLNEFKGKKPSYYQFLLETGELTEVIYNGKEIQK